jgi:predicted small integral membrane protein
MLGSRLGRWAARKQQEADGDAARLKLWLLLLGLAELADLITTRADRLLGGIEANHVSAFALGAGGPMLFWGLKLCLVLAMAVAVMLAIRFARAVHDRRAQIVKVTVARGLQVCVLVLTVAALGNVTVLAYLQ